MEVREAFQVVFFWSWSCCWGLLGLGCSSSGSDSCSENGWAVAVLDLGSPSMGMATDFSGSWLWLVLFDMDGAGWTLWA